MSVQYMCKYIYTIYASPTVFIYDDYKTQTHTPTHTLYQYRLIIATIEVFCFQQRISWFRTFLGEFLYLVHVIREHAQTYTHTHSHIYIAGTQTGTHTDTHTSTHGHTSYMLILYLYVYGNTCIHFKIAFSSTYTKKTTTTRQFSQFDGFTYFNNKNDNYKTNENMLMHCYKTNKKKLYNAQTTTTTT